MRGVWLSFACSLALTHRVGTDEELEVQYSRCQHALSEPLPPHCCAGITSAPGRK